VYFVLDVLDQNPKSAFCGWTGDAVVDIEPQPLWTNLRVMKVSSAVEPFIDTNLYSKENEFPQSDL